MKPRPSTAEAILFLLAGVALALGAVSLAGGCTASQQEAGLAAFEKLGGELCAEGDSWAVCLRKCHEACAAPSTSSTSSSSSSSTGGASR